MGPQATERKRRVCVAKIGAAHGVRGEVKLWSYTDDPGAIARYGALETADGRLLEIETLRPGKGFFIVRFKGICDRSAAETLRNAELYVPRERLPPLAEDEFYQSDLIGLAVVDPAGKPLGTVVAIHNFGAGDIIEVQPLGGGETVMLPFARSFVPEVDLEGGRMVVEPNGFFAAGEAEEGPPPRSARRGRRARHR